MLLCCAKIWIRGLSHQLMQLQTIHLLNQINKPDTQTPRIRIGSESGDILKFLKYRNINISKPEISVYGGSGPLSAVSLHFSFPNIKSLSFLSHVCSNYAQSLSFKLSQKLCLQTNINVFSLLGSFHHYIFFNGVDVYYQLNLFFLFNFVRLEMHF